MFQFSTKCGRCINVHKNIHCKWKKYFFSNPSSFLCWKIKDEGQVKWLKCVCHSVELLRNIFFLRIYMVFIFVQLFLFDVMYNNGWKNCFFTLWICVCYLKEIHFLFVLWSTFEKYFLLTRARSWLFWWQWRKSVGFEFLRLINVAWKTKIANANIFIVTLDLFLVHLRKIFLEWWQHKRHKLIWFYRFHFFSFIAKSIYNKKQILLKMIYINSFLLWRNFWKNEF